MEPILDHISEDENVSNEHISSRTWELSSLLQTLHKDFGNLYVYYVVFVLKYIISSQNFYFVLAKDDMVYRITVTYHSDEQVTV